MLIGGVAYHHVDALLHGKTRARGDAPVVARRHLNRNVGLDGLALSRRQCHILVGAQVISRRKSRLANGKCGRLAVALHLELCLFADAKHRRAL